MERKDVDVLPMETDGVVDKVCHPQHIYFKHGGLVVCAKNSTHKRKKRARKDNDDENTDYVQGMLGNTDYRTVLRRMQQRTHLMDDKNGVLSEKRAQN